MARLSLKPSMLSPNSWKQHPLHCETAVIFTQSQKDFIKLNFDGTAKGNLGAAGSGRVFRDDKGNTICMFSMDCGTMSNNKAELQELKQGLEIAETKRFQRLEVEGDSKLAIEMVIKLYQGISWENII